MLSGIRWCRTSAKCKKGSLSADFAATYEGFWRPTLDFAGGGGAWMIYWWQQVLNPVLRLYISPKSFDVVA